MANKKPPAPPAKPGRPRSEQAKKAILRGAFELLQKSGPARLTVEAVALRAGVGKPTIYRYWANAQELAMAAMMERAPSQAAIEPGDSALSDLRSHVHTIIERFSTHHGRQTALMLATAEHDSELFKAFRNQVVLRGRSEGRTILERAVARGEVRADLPIDTAVDLIYGSIFFRLIANHAPLDEAFGDAIVDVLATGLR
jgi:AcrR family transcriptional regulator